MGDIHLEYIFNPALAKASFPFVMKGIWLTLLISFVSMFFGTILGFFIALARMANSWILRLPAAVYLIHARRAHSGDFVYSLFWIPLYRH